MHVVLNTSTIGPHSGSYASPDIWPFSGLFPHTLRMFSLSLFRLRLAPFFSFPLVSFAIELRPLPLLSTSCPLSRLDITSTAIFILNTGLVSHTTPRGLSPAGHFPSILAFKPGLAEKQATAAPFLPFRLCAFPGNRGPLSDLSSSPLAFPRLSRRPIRLQLSTLITVVCEPVRSASSLSAYPRV